MKSKIFVFALLLACFAWTDCGGDSPDLAKLRAMATSRVRTDRTYIRDAYNRYVYFSGINVGGSTKVPYTVDPLTYVGRPFPLKDAERHFKQIKEMGFNSIRLLFIWEAVEHEAKGVYDEDFLDYFEEIIKLAEEEGLYVLINLHENLFSRHLHVHYNENTSPFYNDGAARNPLLDSVLSTFPIFTSEHKRLSALGRLATLPVEEFFSDRVAGDGAPLWAVKACLPEKDLDSRSWGVFKIFGALTMNEVNSIMDLLNRMGGDSSDSGLNLDALSDSLVYAKKAGIKDGKPQNNNDMMPWTFWGLNAALSLDVERCYAAFFAGDKVFPNLKYELNGEMVSVKEYLQESFTNVWVQIAKRAKKYKNVIGYDIMNEPLSGFIALSAASAYFELGMAEAGRDVLYQLAGEEMGETLSQLIFGLNLLPNIPEKPVQAEGESDADYEVRVGEWEAAKEEVVKNWGFEGADLMAILELNYGFDANYLQPVYERVGRAIQEEDPNAVIWIEESMGLNTILGGGMNTFWEVNMTRPEGVNQVVFAPHWYPDIYPNIGFNVDPREFTSEEWEFRDWRPQLVERSARAQYSLGNIPIVYGEFGTYFNYNNVACSEKDDNCQVSEQILDNFYEAFEDLFFSRMQWCYTADNDAEYGDRWNHEDFSALDYNGEPRAERAYNRPFPRAMSGKPVKLRFNSDLHYYDSDKGIPDSVREFHLEFKSKETDAPTEIYVPHIQYPEGFYVWLSDGYAVFDWEERILYYFPTDDRPEHNHKVTINPPQSDRSNEGFNYLFKDGMVVEGRGGKL